MQNYRFYFLDPLNHILAAEDRSLDSDGAALAVAKQLSTRYPVEVWRSDHCLGRVEAAAQNAESAGDSPFRRA